MSEYIDRGAVRGVLQRVFDECDVEASFVHALSLVRIRVEELPDAWISVKEALPGPEERVLCCTRNRKGEPNFVLGYYTDGMWRVGMNSNVTHWMLLPEPPEEE